MRHLKILGLIAVAATTLIALVGAGSASATVLCTTNSNPCGASWHYTGTLYFTIKPGTSLVLEDTSGFVIETCTEPRTHIVSTTTGSSTTTPVGSFIKGDILWGGCSNFNVPTAGGSLEFHATSGGNGTVTGKSFKFTVLVSGGTCTYGAGTGINLGNYTASTEALVTNTVLNKVEGSFLCPTTIIWTEEDVLTTPANLYFEPS